MKDFKHINMQLLNEVSDGSTELISDLANMFILQSPGFESQLTELYSKNDFEALGKLAHKIKGSVSTLGLSKIAAKMKELELDAKQGINTHKYQELINYYKTNSKEAINELKDLLNEF